MKKLVLRGQTLVEVEESELAPWIPKHIPKPRVKKELRCGQTRECIRPGNFETFINQCTKEKGHKPPHIYEVASEKSKSHKKLG